MSRPHAYYGLFALQHRGQESCGIVVSTTTGMFRAYKDTGLVNDVFTAEAMAALGTGHIWRSVTFATARPAAERENNAQPIVVNHIKGRMALAHNGNLVNSFELRSELELAGSIFHTTSDTEVISYLITKERLSALVDRAGGRAVPCRRLHGAYSLVLMSPSEADRREG